MKLDSDQKGLVKNGMIAMPIWIVGYPLMCWIINGVFSWDDVLHGFLVGLFTGILSLLLVIGSHVLQK